MQNATAPVEACNAAINLSIYPIDQPGSTAYEALIEKCRFQLSTTGACVLDQFITSSALEQLRHEAEQLSPEAYHSSLVGNAYLSTIDETWPADDVRRLTDVTSLGVVAYDQFTAASPLKGIYESSHLKSFLSDAINRGPLYDYECPLGALNLSVMRPNDYLRWHFDQSDFVVSLAIQDAEKGGAFEYVYHIRDEKNENDEDVRALLQGSRNKVKTLISPPGSLVLFEGRYTIHRVTKIEGTRDRYIALLGYASKPGVTSTPYLRQIRYGRSS